MYCLRIFCYGVVLKGSCNLYEESSSQKQEKHEETIKKQSSILLFACKCLKVLTGLYSRNYKSYEGGTVMKRLKASYQRLCECIT